MPHSTSPRVPAALTALSLDALPVNLPASALPLTALLAGLPNAAPPSSVVSAPAPALAAVVAIVGAGGKTTLLYALARALAAHGCKVITATTTHIFPPTPAQSPLCLLSPPLPEVQEALQQYGHVTVAEKAVTNNEHQSKLLGLSFDDIERLRTVSDILLVEADGAAMRPLKAPASHEPAVPPCTELCIALCGLSGLGRSLHDSVHRPERAAALCGLSGCHPLGIVTPTHLAHLALHAQGLFRTVPPSAQRAVLCTVPPPLSAATGYALASQATQDAQRLYPRHPATWWVGSALEGWTVKL